MTTTSPTPLPPANWYPDPGGQGYRYWDGVGWTMHVSAQPVSGGMPPACSQPNPYHPQMRYAVKTGYSTAGIIMGIIAVLFLPIVFGPLGLVFGSIAKSKGDPKGGVAMTVAGVGMVAGMLLGFLAFSAVQ